MPSLEWWFVGRTIPPQKIIRARDPKQCVGWVLLLNIIIVNLIILNVILLHIILNIIVRNIILLLLLLLHNHNNNSNSNSTSTTTTTTNNSSNNNNNNKHDDDDDDNNSNRKSNNNTNTNTNSRQQTTGNRQQTTDDNNNIILFSHKTGTHTLREPAQSKCTWTFHKSCENLQEKCRRPRPPTTLCASLQPLYGRIYRKNARAVGACTIEMQQFGHFTRAILRENFHKSHDRNPHFVRAWAMEMHFGHVTRAILCGNLQVKSRGPNRDQTATHTLCEPGQSKCTWTCHKSHFTQKFTGKMPQTKTTAQTLCEPAQSKCTWTCHESHFVQKFTGKMPQTSWSTLIKHRPLLLP